ncbi:MAG TPA: MgtC/SapB family protein [Pelomicrobium sp.]|nr:MgtC/SapB family protein [Pelomicrobium sp.]
MTDLIDFNQLQILAEVLLAMLLGGAIGVEREIADKPAGFRTHMLIAGAAALLVALGEMLREAGAVDSGAGVVASDPVRVIEAIITGVAFVGAGTIIRGRRNAVEGVTTAASLLMSAAIGIAVALRAFTLAVSATVLTVLVLRLVGTMERRLRRRRASATPASDPGDRS